MKNTKIFFKTKMYNYFIIQGKKFLCENFFLKSFKILQKNTIKNHKNLTKLTIINATPIVQIKQIKKKKRKTIKEFPFILNKKNRIALSIKSILHLLQKKSNKKSEIIFSNILTSNDLFKNDILKVKKENHNQAILKKKYIFFRWFC